MTEDTSTEVELPAEVLIRTLDQLHPLLDSARHTPQVTLNGAAVAKSDTAGLQLLISFIRTLDKEGKAIRWETPSENLHTTARTLGLVEELRLSC